MPKHATVIACGGLGSRFGGDKAQQMLAGKTLLSHAISLARQYGGPIALAGRSGVNSDWDGIPFLVDEQPGIGPISALSSGFAFAAREGCSHLLLLACDQPSLPDDLATRLTASIGSYGVAIPVSDGHDQNMAALWRCEAQGLENYIAAGGRSLWKFAERVGITRVEWRTEEVDLFADIDDRTQLAKARERFRRG